MNYQNYDDYMRSVLGYSPYAGDDYTYTNEQEDIYNYPDEATLSQTTQDLTSFYPEIYKIIYPMVCKVCNINLNREFTNELLEQMTDEIYRNVEPEQEINAPKRVTPQLKNGDVINPNAKEPKTETRGETRQTNFLLRDLIRILLLREWGRPTRPFVRPPFPPPPGRPPMGPGRPGNGRPPMGSPSRPRYY